MPAEATRTWGVKGELGSETHLTLFTCESMGKMAGRAVERQLRAMLCEQDGHQFGPTVAELGGSVCEVCHLVQAVVDA